MKIDKLKQIIDIFNSSDLQSLEIKSFANSIKLNKNQTVQKSASVEVLGIQPQAKAQEKVIDFSDLIEIKSPMVGIFYSASSPDSKNFVKKGDKIKKGDVLCIIEAMKVMNEITSDFDGEIVDICVQNEQLVEYSQVMFKVKK